VSNAYTVATGRSFTSPPATTIVEPTAAAAA
jgi:hypothetical protein